MTNLYPMLFEPVLKDYIWGGRHLADLGRALPAEGIVAESWEIAAHPDGMTQVVNGPYAGKTLQDLLELLGVDLVGTRNDWALARDKFPLLIKLLDANRSLSVQVHPNDEYALVNEGNELGKTEMWVVLQAQPEAAIIYGLVGEATADDLREAIEDGDLAPHLNRLPISVGDHVCVPAGTLHAILEGCVIAEIQQNSNTTYRVFDWNRVGADGKPRPLHVDRALDVLNYEQVGMSLPEAQVCDSGEGWTCELLCRNRYFTTERVRMADGAVYEGKCDGSTLEIWGVIEGSAAVEGEVLSAVQFVLLPAGMGAFSVRAQGDCTLLRTYVG
ncbi:class I mannose-6-phosphate isomerase [bacterium]|nr:class I mannose-6-phosphate isomerase [bacterium]